jgi:hypothetical protein
MQSKLLYLCRVRIFIPELLKAEEVMAAWQVLRNVTTVCV